MTLNEAIREGIRLYPTQAHGNFFNRVGGACVLGCVFAGLGGRTSPEQQYYADVDLMDTIRRTFPGVLITGGTVGCPHQGCTMQLRGHHLLPHLNDIHSWSREAIAEWIDPRPDLHEPMPRPGQPPITAIPVHYPSVHSAQMVEASIS